MHMVNVECLVLCLQLWLATSYSEPMDNVVACEGGTGEFPWTDDTKPLYEVEYFFQNKIIAKSSRPNFSLVEYKDENLKPRLLKDDTVAFRIENVTEKDRGVYKIVLTYTDGDEHELVGTLDVTVPGRGKLNITRETNNKTTSFRCGEKTGSDQYSWDFTNATGEADKKTEESELTLDVLPRHGSFYCVRLSDCQRSPCFNFTSGDDAEVENGTDWGPKTGCCPINKPVAVAVPIILIIIIIVVVVVVIVCRKKRRSTGGAISSAKFQQVRPLET